MVVFQDILAFDLVVKEVDGDMKTLWQQQLDNWVLFNQEHLRKPLRTGQQDQGC